MNSLNTNDRRASNRARVSHQTGARLLHLAMRQESTSDGAQKHSSLSHQTGARLLHLAMRQEATSEGAQKHSSLSARSSTPRRPNAKSKSAKLAFCLAGISMLPGCFAAARPHAEIREKLGWLNLGMSSVTAADQRNGYKPTKVHIYTKTPDYREDTNEWMVRKVKLPHNYSSGVGPVEASSQWELECLIYKKIKEMQQAEPQSYNHIVEVDSVVTGKESPSEDFADVKGVWTKYHGESVASQWKNTEKLPFQDIIDVLEGTFHALRQCWKLEIIHNDVHPKNLCLDEFGDSVKLIDFGEARTWNKELMGGRDTYNFTMVESSVEGAKLKEVQQTMYNILSNIPGLAQYIKENTHHENCYTQSADEYSKCSHNLLSAISEWYAVSDDVHKALIKLWKRTDGVEGDCGNHVHEVKLLEKTGKGDDHGMELILASDIFSKRKNPAKPKRLLDLGELKFKGPNDKKICFQYEYNDYLKRAALANRLSSSERRMSVEQKASEDVEE